MKTNKWILSLIYAASFTCIGLIFWQMGQMVAQGQELQFKQTAKPQSVPKLQTVTQEISLSMSAVSDSEVKRYYFNHIWEFESLPDSPLERVKVWQQINLAIRQKLALTTQKCS